MWAECFPVLLIVWVRLLLFDLLPGSDLKVCGGGGGWSLMCKPIFVISLRHSWSIKHKFSWFLSCLCFCLTIFMNSPQIPSCLAGRVATVRPDLLENNGACTLDPCSPSIVWPWFASSARRRWRHHRSCQFFNSKVYMGFGGKTSIKISF